MPEETKEIPKEKEKPNLKAEAAKAVFADIYTEMAKRMKTGELDLIPSSQLSEMIGEAIGVPSLNLAVEKCMEAYVNTIKTCTAEKRKATAIQKAASLAYGMAMPRLAGRENIGDFIACVTHGMLIGAIPGADGTRLLYAAQVTHSAVPKKRKTLMEFIDKCEKKRSATRSKSTT